MPDEITEVTIDQVVSSFVRGPKVERDMATFNNRPTDKVISDLKSGMADGFGIAIRFGVSAITKEVHRSYARHMWEQTRKPYSVYRGGRWRQMSEPEKVMARFWALSQTARRSV